MPENFSSEDTVVALGHHKVAHLLPSAPGCAQGLIAGPEASVAANSGQANVTTGAGEANVIAGRYELRDQIGRGASGTVYEVFDRRLGRLAALKTMPIGASDDAAAADDLRRFHQEAQAVARLSHQGIVTVHDFGEAGGNAWIVMELVIGETLRAVLDRGERPPVAESARVVCDLLDALHYAHGRGIVHRDVKPANILLAIGAEDGLGAVRLADFGIALMGDADATAPGKMVGTPSTMAPEQLRGDPIDRRADLWAVGIILYELLTGQRAFLGGVPAIFTAILTQQPPPPSALVPDLPTGFDAVIERALAKAPKDRFESASAMAEAVRAAAAGAPVPRPTLPERDQEPAPTASLASQQPSRSFGRLIAAYVAGAATGASVVLLAMVGLNSLALEVPITARPAVDQAPTMATARTAEQPAPWAAPLPHSAATGLSTDQVQIAALASEAEAQLNSLEPEVPITARAAVDLAPPLAAARTVEQPAPPAATLPHSAATGLSTDQVQIAALASEAEAQLNSLELEVPITARAAPLPHSAATGLRTYQVQIAALASEAEARRLWLVLSARHANILDGRDRIIIRADRGDRIVYRLRIGGFTNSAEATLFCARLRAARQACFASAS